MLSHLTAICTGRSGIKRQKEQFKACACLHYDPWSSLPRICCSFVRMLLASSLIINTVYFRQRLLGCFASWNLFPPTLHVGTIIYQLALSAVEQEMDFGKIVNVRQSISVSCHVLLSSKNLIDTIQVVTEKLLASLENPRVGSMVEQAASVRIEVFNRYGQRPNNTIQNGVLTYGAIILW